MKMAKIRIEDLPQEHELSEQDLDKIAGGALALTSAVAPTTSLSLQYSSMDSYSSFYTLEPTRLTTTSAFNIYYPANAVAGIRG
jgi:hypothetical protein